MNIPDLCGTIFNLDLKYLKKTKTTKNKISKTTLEVLARSGKYELLGPTNLPPQRHLIDESGFYAFGAHGGVPDVVGVGYRVAGASGYQLTHFGREYFAFRPLLAPNVQTYICLGDFFVIIS